MNGLRKCGIYIQWDFSQPSKRMKFCHSQINGWNWRASSYVMLARLKGRKITCSPSYADYRPKTNAVIFLDKGHTRREELAEEV
jgi:hypothetical protein